MMRPGPCACLVTDTCYFLSQPCHKSHQGRLCLLFCHCKPGPGLSAWCAVRCALCLEHGTSRLLGCDNITGTTPTCLRTEPGAAACHAHPSSRPNVARQNCCLCAFCVAFKQKRQTLKANWISWEKWFHWEKWKLNFFKGPLQWGRRT